jgi:hypothetical protein
VGATQCFAQYAGISSHVAGRRLMARLAVCQIDPFICVACVDGREMRKEVPDLPFLREVRKRSVPRCFETIRWESQRPRPVPEILLVM